MGRCIGMFLLVASALASRAVAQMEVRQLPTVGVWGNEQDRELETDRDTFTFAPTTAGAGRTITEASYSFIDNATGPELPSVSHS